MWFYDEVPEDYQAFRQQALELERQHMETRGALEKTQAALRDDPDNPQLKAQVMELETKLREIDKRAPWISQGMPLEIALWGMPH